MGCICGKASPVEDNREGLNEKQADLVMPSGTSSRREGSFRMTSSRRDGSFRLKERPDGGGSRFGSIKKANGSRRVRGDHFEKKRENSGVVVPDYPGMGNIPKAKEGEQVAAGWPSWLAAVAGEAINGWLPRSIHTFEILEKIGKGTYSSVYKAQDLKHKKFVALKKVRFDNMDPESVKFMAREILILRRLDHPNVIKLEGLVSSRTSCSLYLVIEYMEHDLTGLASLPGIKFTEPQIKCYMQQLLSGLHHCHSHGILHRDIKGSNLLIDNHGILKIADFGLANFFDKHQSLPLTSRVVTLWYRPPELLLGATHYGVSVDLWSTGCILGELYAGKALMPGRTEIEQLHKIFKLCGSPSEDYWRKSKLPRSTGFRSLQPYKQRLAETFKDFPLAALGLMETLLSIDPAHRGTADSALKSEFFTTKPFACDPSNLPKYPPSKEIDARLRDEEARRQETTRGGGKRTDQEKRGPRKSQAIPAPDANAELVTSMQRRPYHSNSKSRSELFNPHQEEAALGFPIDPPRQKDPLDHIPKRVAHSGPLVPVVEWTKSGKKYDDISVVSTRADLSTFSGLLASKTSSSQECQDKLVPKRATHSGPLAPVAEWTKAGKKYDDISIVSTRAEFSGLLVSRTSSVEELQQRATTQMGMFSESYKESGPTRRQERKCYAQSIAGSGRIEYGKHNTKEPVPHRRQGNRIHFSGPLLVPSNNVDQMLKEHNRHFHEHDHHIQESARRARRVEFQAQGLQVAPNPLHMAGRGAGYINQ